MKAQKWKHTKKLPKKRLAPQTVKGKLDELYLECGDLWIENHQLRKALKDQIKMRKEDVDFIINELMRLHALLAHEREAMEQKIKITDSMLYVVISGFLLLLSLAFSGWAMRIISMVALVYSILGLIGFIQSAKYLFGKEKK